MVGREITLNGSQEKTPRPLTGFASFNRFNSVRYLVKHPVPWCVVIAVRVTNKCSKVCEDEEVHVRPLADGLPNFGLSLAVMFLLQL